MNRTGDGHKMGVWAGGEIELTTHTKMIHDARVGRVDTPHLPVNAKGERFMCENTDYYKKPVFLTPVKQGPFYALKVGPALLAVCGGLKCNNDFQCLDENGEVIEGLYVLGNIMGDITAVDYPINVAGNSHGRCITFGYLLGHELAEA